MLNRPALLRLAWSALLILLLTAGLRELNSIQSNYGNYPERTISSSELSIPIEVPMGATGTLIGKLLEEAGVVKSAESFFRAAVGNPKSAAIAPGTHQLSLRISAAMAVEQLLDPKRIVGLVKVSEGAWNNEIMRLLKSVGISSRNSTNDLRLVTLPDGISNLEGVLFPAQYSFEKGTTLKVALAAMVDKFTKVSQSFDFKDPAGKLSKQELVVIASLVQAEGDTKDFAKISRVIRNRLAVGMPLQFDSTVHYLKQVRGEIFLSRKSTTLKSPYNTYQSVGLPPAPIGNPGEAALKAAVSPAAGDWIYFITVAPGDTRFTKSYSEFTGWKKLYQKNRVAGAFE